MNDFDIDIWMDELAKKLIDSFGNRLMLVGIQGSRGRGEAKESSDIDAVVVIDGLTNEDIELYRKIISTMPHSDLACGFIGSPEVLANWPRHDVFNLVNDTKPVHGSFDFMDTEFSSEDAVLSAKVGASEIYHALCHTKAFEPQALDAVLQACVKNAFFVMRALAFARSGEYPDSRSQMLGIADEDESTLLEAYENPKSIDSETLAELLLEWSRKIIAYS